MASDINSKRMTAQLALFIEANRSLFAPHYSNFQVYYDLDNFEVTMSRPKGAKGFYILLTMNSNSEIEDTGALDPDAFDLLTPDGRDPIYWAHHFIQDKGLEDNEEVHTMSKGKGNPRTICVISSRGAEVIRDTIKKNFKSDIFPDYKDYYISVSLDPSADFDPKSIHFWVDKEGIKEIPDTEVLLGIWDHGRQLYSMDGLLMSGMNFAKESIDRPERYSKDGQFDLLYAFENVILTNEEMRGFYKGNIIKYAMRYTKKNGIEDLKKCQVYTKRLIEFERKVAEKND